eukprot:CAMPEP_0201605528 /NCGR_PEP_ID=MMETSP0492-20130828/5310_1 /ASSEMBLY_ACC=CAM_ASM_000837 /TAXON_ID=420259 /ORGANISM="Thalassiosira gravida, Strain GMp14c1" /LENGTH=226 /DNA_ID=CAMNT_0048069789 /DNA_START=310 /DNA_END=990 /DNA_ORIENTATION=-
MTLRNQKSRQRSFSDDTNSPHMTDAINAGDPTKMMRSATTTTKHHSHPHRHGHGHGYGNRPRSKSCEVHKKNHSAKRSSHVTHSPSRHHLHHHVRGRTSPKTLPCHQHQQLRGKLWIRPVAVVEKRHPFQPASDAAASQAVEDEDTSPAPTSRKDGPRFANRTFVDPTSSKDDPLIRTVTDSPVYDREMIWTSVVSQNSSFLQQRHGPKKVIFGESGKPIQARDVF